MKKYSFILIILLVFAFTSSAKSEIPAEVKTGIFTSKGDADNYLNSFVPDEYLLYQKAIGNNSETEAVNALLAMIRKANSLYRARRVHDQTLGQLAMTYEFAWMIAIQYSGKVKSKDEDGRILAEWNASIQSNSDMEALLFRQLHVLSWEWNQKFISGEFLRLFKDTLDPNIIQQYFFVFEINGGKSEQDLIYEKMKQITENYDRISASFQSASIGIKMRE